jgi:hypothetical protein
MECSTHATDEHAPVEGDSLDDDDDDTLVSCLNDEAIALGGDVRCDEVNVKCAYRVMVLQQRDQGHRQRSFVKHESS